MLITVYVPKFLHFDYQTKMRMILRENPLRRLMFRTKVPQQMGLVHGGPAAPGARILNVVELVTGKIEGTVEKYTSQTNFLIGMLPPPEPVFAH